MDTANYVPNLRKTPIDLSQNVTQVMLKQINEINLSAGPLLISRNYFTQLSRLKIAIEKRKQIKNTQ
jgi:hypothetical protein